MHHFTIYLHRAEKEKMRPAHQRLALDHRLHVSAPVQAGSHAFVPFHVCLLLLIPFSSPPSPARSPSPTLPPELAEPTAAMASSLMAAPVAVFFLALTLLLMLGGTEAKFMSSNNITVVGSVYCDACSNNTFSKHSFFLKGARVLIQCNFKVNSTTSEELSLQAERITDQNGVYKLDVPLVDGFACREGHELRSACRATLVRSSSAACNVPGLRGSTQHIALRSRATNACFLNLNALNFRPPKRDSALCHGGGGGSAGDAFGSSLFFWPFLPLFWPPFRLPFPTTPGGAGGTVSFPWPFPVPQWLVPFLRPPFLPFPLYEPAPPPFYHFPPAEEAASRP